MKLYVKGEITLVSNSLTEMMNFVSVMKNPISKRIFYEKEKLKLNKQKTIQSGETMKYDKFSK